MGRHEDKDKAAEQRLIDSNGHKPGPIPAEDPGGKHGKPDDHHEEDPQDDSDTGT